VVLKKDNNGTHNISGRPSGIPILDIQNKYLLDKLAEYPEIKIKATWGRIDFSPSIQGFHIAKKSKPLSDIRVMHLFAGGGTFSTACQGIPELREVASVEISPKYAKWHNLTHPNCETLVIADVRQITPYELPDFDLLMAGIPCADTSNLGRTRKGLAGAPETGQLVDLFLPVMNLISCRRPAAIILENVPNYANDITGTIIRHHLTALGYSISESILQPNQDWGDIQDRKRWCLIATLNPNFELEIPHTPCTTLAKTFLDPINPEQDKKDVENYQKTVQGLTKREAEHKENGNGFRFSVINPESTKIPTITKACSKGNLQGPWVETPYGKRLLRTAELSRFSGHKLPTNIDHTSAAEIIGQGGTVRTWHQILQQVTNFLKNPTNTKTNNLNSNIQCITTPSTPQIPTKKQTEQILMNF
jgi:site-specific DNA-cytosine methylase